MYFSTYIYILLKFVLYIHVGKIFHRDYISRYVAQVAVSNFKVFCFFQKDLMVVAVVL